VPLHAPLQPVNVDPVAAAAVSVTEVPLAYCAEQVAPQSMPDGELVAVPDPVPALVTVRVCGGGGTSNVAVTERAWSIVTTHVPVPLQPPPLQPLNVEPPAAVAVSVTTVP
jgi:hypothetical protein